VAGDADPAAAIDNPGVASAAEQTDALAPQPVASPPEASLPEATQPQAPQAEVPQPHSNTCAAELITLASATRLRMLSSVSMSVWCEMPCRRTAHGQGTAMRLWLSH
jgi:hypothetical protein